MPFTKIFKMANYSVVGGTTYTVPNVPYKDRAGTNQTGIYTGGGIPAPLYQVSNTVNPAVSATSASPVTFLAVGNGNTAFSEDDYDLASRISTGITYNATTTAQATYDSSTGKTRRTATYSITASAPITISEVGLFMYLLTGPSGSWHLTLMYREVLSAPISLAAGETVVLAISIAGG